ncbi:pyridoxal phosphate-dependent decarboxylase family protein [Flavihumibacter sp. UBA7668]|uniref:pyridoxal phosphate-dependent decarboxylase family protein n=1 Tax=Flavihumibacter sp. UBA7668 TaxID=1946542 RepID=UPI0025B9B39A|nr:pyridoxal-dependent decarboxylase [Flavihumibacter sp. UBA7668]
MNPIIKEDLDQLAQLLDAARKMGEAHLQQLTDHPTSTNPENINWPDLPETGLGALGTLEMFRTLFYPHIVASSGPRYWGFVTGGTTPAAIMGDWLSSVYDQNTQLTSGRGDASALLEIQTVQLLLDLFDLPDTFMGAFVTGATMANFSGLAVARQWAGQQLDLDIARDGLRMHIPVYSAQPHSSSLKALSMLGMGSSTIQQVPTLPDREAIDISALRNLLPSDKMQPVILVASAGTVNSVDFDDLQTLAELKKEHNCWIHVDAAFGGFAALSKEHKHLLIGWELADSITVDFHKWLNVPYDSAMIFTRKEHAVLQIQTFQNSSAPYLGNPWEQFSYLNYVPENSRRFRALSVWFSLMAYGKSGYQSIVEESIEMANYLADQLLQTGCFRLLAPVRLNTVCFQPIAEMKGSFSVAEFLDELNREGIVFMTPSQYKGETCIRAALVNFRTNRAEVDKAMDSVNRVIKKLAL